VRVSDEVGVVWLGAAYGVGLGFLAFVSAGFGHGTYSLVGVSSAPIGVLGIPAALFGGAAHLGQERRRKGDGRKGDVAAFLAFSPDALALRSQGLAYDDFGGDTFRQGR
jgi:hypothetical protein